MLEWIDMEVVHTAFPVIFITAGVLLKYPWPDSKFALYLTTW